MTSLDKFSGAWSSQLAAHLLRRTTYGVGYQVIKEFGEKGLDFSINTLFNPQPLPPPPVNLSYADDPNAAIGQTWVDKGTSQNVTGYRNSSIRGWSFDLITNGNARIVEKMTMFWHNHFVTADINDPRFTYRYITLLRSQALGSFRQLTKDITIDPGMLDYLNGRQNTNVAPNENYARELLELFTLGKGDLVGPGDYTSYTEGDIKEIAKVLTGWNWKLTLPIGSEFNAARHDTATKKLSARFNNATISNAGVNEYKNLIDIIFQKPEVALFIARKLYRFFVHTKIDSDIEQNIIVPLAKIIRDNDYEMAIPVKTLLSSQHFYDDCVQGVMIKNPIDFIVNPVNQFNTAWPTDQVLKYRVLLGLYNFANTMQMAIYQAPSVAGWASYYQEPSYGRLWLNASSLPSRKSYTDGLVGTGILYSPYRLQINVLDNINLFSTPSDPDTVLSELSLLLLPKPLADNQKTVLKAFLLAGTPTGWTTAYNTYKADPNNETKRATIISRLRSMIVYMMRMPEYHLS